MQILYAFFQTEDADLRTSEKQLLRSVERMYELYLSFLLTFEEVQGFAQQRIEDRQNKVRATKEDLSPNLRFVNNPIIQHFKLNNDLKRASEELKIDWTGVVENDLMKKLFLKIIESDIYLEYMALESTDFETDKKFVVDLFKSEIANFELLHDYYEDQSIFWLDDIDLMCSMVVKSIKLVTEESDEKDQILRLHKDKADEIDFILELLRKTGKYDEENSKLIDELTQNWELDRIAKMDIILLKMAITELKVLSSIPKKVTLNEYIEISKFYSTPKSQVFINGILDKAIELLEERGELKKTGRGLIN
ncbi:transcription antitermination protein NusB [Crocinitomix catalasitica]|uniref:transcription antitermination protein NusB n=1 Tax=Crocinitomix catalasitica TaxID=184607 RepID=UPI000489A190|nr:transcription antitermination protein NusB [Crocinitomix catalasitica]